MNINNIFNKILFKVKKYSTEKIFADDRNHKLNLNKMSQQNICL